MTLVLLLLLQLDPGLVSDTRCYRGKGLVLACSGGLALPEAFHVPLTWCLPGLRELAP